MIPRLLLRLTTHPGLFADHLGAYAELAATEADALGRRWRRRGAWALGALLGGTLAVGLAGVAVLLVAALPVQPMRAPWALWLVPLAFAGVAAICAWGARATAADAAAFPQLRRQLDADAQLLREVDAT